jgi:hypothetical protein
MDIEDCDDAFIEDRVLAHVDGGMARSFDDCVFEDQVSTHIGGMAASSSNFIMEYLDMTCGWNEFD